MRHLLVALFLSLTISAYAQKNNITVKLISYRVFTKPFNEDYSEEYQKYGLDLSGSPLDESVKNNIGLQLSTQFANELYNNALTGKITVYDPFYTTVTGSDVNFPVIMSTKEIFETFNWSDSATISSPYPPYAERDTVYSGFFNPENVVAIDFYETWTINAKTMAITKKMIAICPILASYVPGTNEFRNLGYMFWVKM